ncbi:hypothetical protein BH10CYA1_BH10CYA1_00320 [soil metagenome]
MRCPECTERNSVAARSCDACGFKFKRKPVPVTVWAGLGIVATALTFWGVASAVVPSLTDPSKSLARVAKNFLAGPKNPEHATKLKTEFDNSVKEFLVANGKDPSPELVKKLQTILASDSFEVHSFELPRGLKVVEVDTILQASDFLVINSPAGTKVFTLPEFEVFDSAQILNDQARNSLVLIGHSAGQGARKAQVKVFALLPDDVQDETAKALPPILGEGTATFAPNHKDIVADLSLFSIGVAQGLFKPQQPSIGRGEEERVKQTLTWKDGAYTSNLSNGKGALAALFSVARCMQAPADSDRFANSLSPKALAFIKSNQIKLDAPNFIVGQTESPSKQHRTPTVSRLLLGSSGNSYRVELQKVGDGAQAHVVVSNLKRTDETIALTPKVKPPDMVAVTPPTTATPTPPPPAITTTTTLTPVQVANIDPGFNHHQATIVEKKTSAKKELKNDMPIEDRIINSSKNQTLIQSSKDESVKNVPSKQIAKEFAKATAKTQGETTAATNESPKVGVVESRAQAVRYPVDEVISPSLEKTADSNINLRRGPSNGYRTLAHLKPGAKFEVIGKKDGWYKVRSGGTEGFIAISAIDSKKSSATPSSSSTTSTNTTQTKPEPVTTSSKPEPKSTKSSTSPVPVKTASSSTASKSSTPASSSSSKFSAVKDTTEPMQKGLTSGTLNRNRTIRDENHNPIGVATKGVKVVVLTGLKNGKYKVQLPSGKTGYVDKETVDVVNDAPQFVP